MKIISKIIDKKRQYARNISRVFSFSFVQIYLLIFLALNISSWLFVYIFYTRVSQSLVVLHYNIDFGVDLIGDVSKIFIIPTLGLFIWFFNFLLMFLFAKNENFKSIIHLLLVGAIVANLFLFLSLGPIYLINFR